jgi:hypothetical protein
MQNQTPDTKMKENNNQGIYRTWNTVCTIKHVYRNILVSYVYNYVHYASMRETISDYNYCFV